MDRSHRLARCPNSRSASTPLPASYLRPAIDTGELTKPGDVCAGNFARRVPASRGGKRAATTDAIRTIKEDQR